MKLVSDILLQVFNSLVNHNVPGLVENGLYAFTRHRGLNSLDKFRPRKILHTYINMANQSLNLMFLALLVLLTGAVGVANFVEASNSQAKPGQRYTGMMWLTVAVALVLYKVSNR